MITIDKVTKGGDMMEFGEYLKHLREKKKMSIRKLSTYSGVSAGYLSQIENGGRSTPSPSVIKKLAKGLKTPYEDMMRAAGYIKQDEDNQPAELTEFLENANVMFHGVPMTEEDKKRIEDVLTILFWDAKKRREKEKGDTNDLDGSRNSRN